MFEPTTLPILILPNPLSAESTLTTNSGALVANATSVRPTPEVIFSVLMQYELRLLPETQRRNRAEQVRQFHKKYLLQSTYFLSLISTPL